MLQPSPELQERIDKYNTHDAIDAKALKLEWRRLKRRRAALNRVFAGTALLGIGGSAYMHDVENNQAVQAEASISVQIEGQALDSAHDDNALVFIDGFGSYNSNVLTEYMSKAVQPIIDGQLWSVEYNNAPLETADIAKNIIETALYQGVTSLSIVGYSAGGDVAMQVQEEIRKDSNLDIQALFLTSTPNGAKALRPARRDEVNLVEQFSWIPGVQYSTPLRFLGELAFRADRYTSGNNISEHLQNFNPGNFIETIAGVNDSLNANELPGTWLMFDQMLAIENADLEKRIDEMKKIPANQIRPTIIYIGTAKPGYDYMINDEKSSEEIRAYAQAADVPFLSYKVPGAVHTRIDLANSQYIKVLGAAKKAIRSNIARQESAAQLQRSSNYGPWTRYLTIEQ